MTDSLLRSASLADIATARAIAHRATQHLTKAARANLEAQPDDSHSNLGWDHKQNAFLSQPIDGKYVGLSIAPLSLFILEGSEHLESLTLNNLTDAEAGQWLDRKLAGLGLSAGSSTELPYELPADVANVENYRKTNDDAGLDALSAWFQAASNALDNFVSENTDIVPGPSAVRCWPHHFDIATYVSMESGDPETARGVGVGMSPGDEGYNEPYFYINPWPHLDKDALPEAIAPGHWHAEGYVGSIATASELLTTNNIEEAVSSFIAKSFSAGRAIQGI